MNEIECETCIKRKTKYCPNSSECYETKEKPYYQNRIMLLEEIQKYKEVIDKLNVKLNQYKNDLKVYQKQDTINHRAIAIGLIELKIRAFEDILKEVE